MTNFRKSLLAGAVIAALGASALAQQLTSQTLTGNETWAIAIGGPQGPSMFTTTAQMRNSQGVTLTALTGGTLALTTNTATLITTAIVATALAVTTPAAPFDGEIFELVNGSGSANTATVTLTANAVGGQTVNGGAITVQPATSSNEWRYVLSSNTWYKMR